MESISHFVITRFNLRIYGRDKNNVPTHTDEWLNGRFELFERYCLPSMRAQTNRNFVWLCLLDDQTPESYRKRVEEYRQSCPMLRPVYYSIDQAADLADSLRRDIAALAAPGTKYILTTNLDNDDALSIHAIAKLQEKAKPSPGKTVYVFRKGCQYFTQLRYALKLLLPNNHFLTLKEPFDGEFETIAAFRHARVNKLFKTVYLFSKAPMWLEIIHPNNVSNDLRIYSKAYNIPILSSRSFADFGLDMKVGWLRQTTFTFFVLPFKVITTGYTRLKGKSKRRKDSKSVRCESTDFL